MSDEDRFRRLYREHYPALLAYALRRWPDPSEAQDIVADSFLVLWRRLANAPRDEEILPWLYAVSRRVLSNRQRAQTRRERLLAQFQAILRDAPAAEETASLRLDAQKLLAALLELSDSDREILLLAAWEGLPLSGLAAALGCSENAAAIRLHRARKKLTEVYRKENAGAGHKQGERLRLRRPRDQRKKSD
jgi:RNA polymerase sigma-70 factor (ECF subfamily)